MKRAAYTIASIVMAIGLIGLFFFLVEGKQLPVLNPTGEVADAQRNLFLFTVSLSALVVLPVFGLLAYISIKFREGNTRANYRPEWSENGLLESIWWGIPILIIGGLAVVTYQTSHSLDPYKQLSGEQPLEVQVVAMQWKWLFLYPDQGVASLNQVYIPSNRPVRLTMTADAPMSAFWIPSLGSQTYAMNGMHSQLNLKGKQEGEYTGYTTNINGEGYAKMTFTAKVVKQNDFNAWVASTSKAPSVMDMTEYDKLAKPMSMTEERIYTMPDKTLFSSISSKYDHSHGMSDEEHSS